MEGVSGMDDTQREHWRVLLRNPHYDFSMVERKRLAEQLAEPAPVATDTPTAESFLDADDHAIIHEESALTHDCADHAITADEGTSYCPECERQARTGDARDSLIRSAIGLLRAQAQDDQDFFFIDSANEALEALDSLTADLEFVRNCYRSAARELYRALIDKSSLERELADAREIAHVAARLSQEEGFEGSPNLNEADLAKMLKRYLRQHDLASNDRHCVCSYCNSARAALSRVAETGGT